MLFRGSLDAIKEGLTLSAMRQEMIAANIANVSTPGYRRVDLDFERLMKSGIKSSSRPAYRTNEKHFTFEEIGSRAGLFSYPSDSDVNSEDNNVDIDKEIMNMNNNSMYYNALTTFAEKKYRGLRSVISGSPT